MGYFKQLHIDCYQDNCLVNQEETCYMQKDNVSYFEEGDYNALMDEDLEGYESTTTNTQEKDITD